MEDQIRFKQLTCVIVDNFNSLLLSGSPFDVIQYFNWYILKEAEFFSELSKVACAQSYVDRPSHQIFKIDFFFSIFFLTKKIIFSFRLRDYSTMYYNSVSVFLKLN